MNIIPLAGYAFGPNIGGTMGGTLSIQHNGCLGDWSKWANWARRFTSSLRPRLGRQWETNLDWAETQWKVIRRTNPSTGLHEKPPGVKTTTWYASRSNTSEYIASIRWLRWFIESGKVEMCLGLKWLADLSWEWYCWTAALSPWGITHSEDAWSHGF